MSSSEFMSLTKCRLAFKERMLGESFAFADTKGPVCGSNYMDFKIKYTREYIYISSIAIYKISR
jgi:hypothetical protein